MQLEGKKVFCFLALKHHSRFLVPITRALEARGMRIMYLTAPAEMPFELTLQDEGLPFYHCQAYADRELDKQIDAAYRQVRAAWKEKILESPILHYFTLPVQDKILRMHVDNFYLFRRMFEVEKPDLVLALHELNSWGKMLGYLSHEFHVPMVTLQEGLYYAPAAFYRFHTEYSSACLVWGEATKEILVRSGASADKIFIVGNTHLYSVVARESRPDAVARTEQELGLSSGQTVITLLMGGLGYDRGFSFPRELLDWVRANPKVVLVCKWHPVTNKLAIEEIAESLKSIPNVVMVQQFDTYRLLAASDICVVFGNSTTGLEALAFDKPLVEVELPGLDYSFARQGVAESVTSLAEVPRAINDLMSGAVAPERRARVGDYLRRNLYKTDGKSVERCVAFVGSMLAAREAAPAPVAVPRRQPVDAFQCSIIVPLVEPAGVSETLIGVAENSSTEAAYECLISSAGDAQEETALMDMLGGDARLFRSDRSGLASLYNLAAAHARGRYLCFLAPGWVPQPNWLEIFLRHMEAHCDVGIAGGMGLFIDGTLAHAGIVFDANLSPASLYRRAPATLPGAHRPRRVQAVHGCLFVRREAFVAAGGFDADYQGPWSELDFCLNAAAKGWKSLYVPESLFVVLNDERSEADADRRRFFSKWVGYLWPDQDKAWAEDGLDSKSLLSLYEDFRRGSNGAAPAGE